MFQSCVSTIVCAALMAPVSLAAAPPIYKCVVKGVVTYQADPCPSGHTRNHPTVEQLNAERKKRLSAPLDGAAALAAPMPGGQRPPNQHAAPTGPTPGGQQWPAAASPTASPAVSFRCDGRRYCSQMTSCAEARYFLASCPGAKMDGDGDGIPYEQQWCTR